MRIFRRASRPSQHPICQISTRVSRPLKDFEEFVEVPPFFYWQSKLSLRGALPIIELWQNATSAKYLLWPRSTTSHRSSLARVAEKASMSLMEVDEDFTWKDPKEYIIGGMDQGFKLKLYHALSAMDEAGLSPGITSAFRDAARTLTVLSALRQWDLIPPYGGSNPTTPASQCGLPTRPPSYRERCAIPGRFSRGALSPRTRFQEIVGRCVRNLRL